MPFGYHLQQLQDRGRGVCLECSSQRRCGGDTLLPHCLCMLRQVVDGQTLDRMESGRSASTSKLAGKRNADRRREAAGGDGDALAFADLIADGASPRTCCGRRVRHVTLAHLPKLLSRFAKNAVIVQTSERGV